MKPKTDIYVIRHGETIWNASKKLQGRKDIPLTDLGRLQAQQMGQTLKNISFDFIGASPLQRTLQTASIIASELNTSFKVCEDLKARNYGVWEGHSIDELHAEFSELFSHLRKWSLDDVFLKQPHESVESYKNVSERALGFIHSTIQSHSTKNILIVTHSGVITSLLLALNHPTQEIPVIEQDGIVIIHHDEGGFHLADVKGLVTPKKPHGSNEHDRVFIF
jgi:broad specificity phosphatase PhoE